jgi:lysophospholipase L1-like esterase
MTKTLMTFGDSNTFGTPPMTSPDLLERFGIGVRWPTVTHATLGSDWHLIEEGLPGRTATTTPHPTRGAAMDGHMGLRIALASHGPIDVLTIMLGTNDVQHCYGLTADCVIARVAGLLAITQHPDMGKRHPNMDILLICPQPTRDIGIFTSTMMGAAEKSKAFSPLYQNLAGHWNIGFLDAGEIIKSCSEDGVHFDAEAHQTLGLAVAETIQGLGE